ncbi:MAG TPA: VOC family protein [Chloroflexota bacterium]|jgi:catechol 2,3-dioxygenase-like lactoylglutathione lyase family enzyme
MAARVTGLGHVGVYVRDMPKMLDFYTRVLGMTITDRGGERIVFLSAQPDREHHELALAHSEDQKTEAGQVSFRVDSLGDLKNLYQDVKNYGCRFDRVVSHGNAFGAYFRDPEDNIVEIYWPTGIDYPQPFGQPIDLEASDEVLLKGLDDLPPHEGTGPHLYGKDVGKRRTVRPQEATHV